MSRPLCVVCADRPASCDIGGVDFLMCRTCSRSYWGPRRKGNKDIVWAARRARAAENQRWRDAIAEAWHETDEDSAHAALTRARKIGDDKARGRTRGGGR